MAKVVISHRLHDDGIGKIQLAFEKNISRFTNLEASGDDIYAH